MYHTLLATYPYLVKLRPIVGLARINIFSKVYADSADINRHKVSCPSAKPSNRLGAIHIFKESYNGWSLVDVILGKEKITHL